jgi:hypothetical protein
MKTDWQATWRNWIRNNKKPKRASREEENKKAIREFLKNEQD